jgi:hypothetical protein
MDVDAGRMLDDFASELARIPPDIAPPRLVSVAQAAFDDALRDAAGRVDDPRWASFYREAQVLVARLDARGSRALPGLRAFLAENADLAGLLVAP